MILLVLLENDSIFRNSSVFLEPSSLNSREEMKDTGPPRYVRVMIHWIAHTRRRWNDNSMTIFWLNPTNLSEINHLKTSHHLSLMDHQKENEKNEPQRTTFYTQKLKSLSVWLPSFFIVAGWRTGRTNVRSFKIVEICSASPRKKFNITA